jgi:hypothetical protein
MEPPNTYTYRQSELPPITDEIKSEIAEIDFNVANLILKFQGNYYALLALAETLAGCMNEAEDNLYKIRIIPDGGEPELLPRAIGLTDLPILEKQLLISTAITSTVAIKVLAGIFNCDFEQATSHVRQIGQAEFSEMSPEQIEKAVVELEKKLRENPDGGGFAIEV